MDFQAYCGGHLRRLHTNARDFICRFIADNAAKFSPLTPAAAGAAIWSTIEGAVIKCAALARMSITDRPAGMDIHGLQLSTACLSYSSFCHLSHSIVPQLVPHTSHLLAAIPTPFLPATSTSISSSKVPSRPNSRVQLYSSMGTLPTQQPGLTSTVTRLKEPLLVHPLSTSSSVSSASNRRPK